MDGADGAVETRADLQNPVGIRHDASVNRTRLVDHRRPGDRGSQPERRRRFRIDACAAFEAVVRPSVRAAAAGSGYADAERVGFVNRRRTAKEPTSRAKLVLVDPVAEPGQSDAQVDTPKVQCAAALGDPGAKLRRRSTSFEDSQFDGKLPVPEHAAVVRPAFISAIIRRGPRHGFHAAMPAVATPRETGHRDQDCGGKRQSAGQSASHGPKSCIHDDSRPVPADGNTVSPVNRSNSIRVSCAPMLDSRYSCLAPSSSACTPVSSTKVVRPSS